jgi:hypothetical protein
MDCHYEPSDLNHGVRDLQHVAQIGPMKPARGPIRAPSFFASLPEASGHLCVAGFERVAGGGGVVGAGVEVGVDAEGDVRVGVAELAADIDDVQPLRDQERGVGVAERLERDPTPRG